MGRMCTPAPRDKNTLGLKVLVPWNCGPFTHAQQASLAQTEPSPAEQIGNTADTEKDGNLAREQESSQLPDNWL